MHEEIRGLRHSLIADITKIETFIDFFDVNEVDDGARFTVDDIVIHELAHDWYVVHGFEDPTQTLPHPGLAYNVNLPEEAFVVAIENFYRLNSHQDIWKSYSTLPLPDSSLKQCCEDTTACINGNHATCSELASDVNNCGQCGNACSGTTSCCAGACTDVSSDWRNCGSCGHACQPIDMNGAFSSAFGGRIYDLACVSSRCQCPGALPIPFATDLELCYPNGGGPPPAQPIPEHTSGPGILQRR